MKGRLKAWLNRFQELTGWAPFVFALALGAWVLLGALGTKNDNIRQLIEMPINSLYLILPAGMAYLLWRRWSIRLTAEQLEAHWNGIRAAKVGDIIIYVTNAVFYLCAFALSLYFFSKFR